MTKRLPALLVVCGLLGALLAGCGDDDAGSDTAENDTTETDTANADTDDTDAAEDGDAAPVDDSTTGGDDLLNQYLAMFGLNSDIMTADQAGCMNDELELLYPDGFPSGWESSESVVDEVDAIAVRCEVEL